MSYRNNITSILFGLSILHASIIFLYLLMFVRFQKLLASPEAVYNMEHLIIIIINIVR